MWLIVTGHQAIEIEKFLPTLSARVGIPVVSERVLHWSTPNGYSVIAGAARIEGDYLLMMADHIFEVFDPPASGAGKAPKAAA